MTFAEYLKQNHVETEGRLFSDEPWGNLENILGKEVWICNYRLNDKKEMKPIRNVSPKLVRIVSNDELPKSKSVYYSDVHFREVKNGKILSTVIGPYDNTGFRGYRGVSVSIFSNRTGCVLHYKKQIQDAILQYNLKMQEIQSKVDELKLLIAEYAD